MTDITEGQGKEVRRIMDWMQQYEDGSEHYCGNPREWLRDLREIFPEPVEPTLAEELRDRATLVENGDPSGDTYRALRDLADQAESLDESLSYWKEYALDRQREVERLTVSTVAPEEKVAPDQKANTKVTLASSIPRRTDVPPREPWLIRVGEREAVAVRDGDPEWPWSLTFLDGETDCVADKSVILISRLVHESAVIK